MAYDEESLFTGIRIGQTMKGWASAGGSGEGGAQHVKMPSLSMPLPEPASKQHNKTVSLSMSLLAIDISIAKQIE